MSEKLSVSQIITLISLSVAVISFAAFIFVIFLGLVYVVPYYIFKLIFSILTVSLMILILIDME